MIPFNEIMLALIIIGVMGLYVYIARPFQTPDYMKAKPERTDFVAEFQYRSEDSNNVPISTQLNRELGLLQEKGANPEVMLIQGTTTTYKNRNADVGDPHKAYFVETLWVIIEIDDIEL